MLMKIPFLQTFVDDHFDLEIFLDQKFRPLTLKIQHIPYLG